MRGRIDGSTMPTQAYFMQLARRCRFLSHHTLDLRVARELRILGDELEHKAREAQTAADAAVPAVVAYAPASTGRHPAGIIRNQWWRSEPMQRH
jgi:hypothetical protein